MPEPSAEKPPPAIDPREPVMVGTITGASGLIGAVKVESQTDSPHRFSPGATLFLGDKPVKVTASHRTNRSVVVKLEHVNDREQAAALRGTVLTVPPSDLEPLPEGSYYYYEIIGIGVWDEHGTYLGKVAEIISTRGNDVYVARGPDGADVLIPALADVLLEIAPEEKRMVVRLPEGL